MKMLHRPVARPPRDIYPVSPWGLIERGFHPQLTPQSETLFAVANGYLGIRGALEEGEPVHEHGTFVNGFHETWRIHYPETAFGLATVGQSIVGLPDASGVTLSIDDEQFRLTEGRVVRHERQLDFRTGVLARTLEWESPGGVRLQFESQRFVSFTRRHVAAFRILVRVLGGNGRMRITSGLVNRQTEVAGHEQDPRRGAALGDAIMPMASRASETGLLLMVQTRDSGMTAAAGARHLVEASARHTTSHESNEDEASTTFAFDATPGAWVRLDKLAAYHTSMDCAPDSLEAAVEETLGASVAVGFDDLLEEQRTALAAFWRRADVRIEGDPAVQQAVRWNLFQLAQATLCADGHGVPAKGLTGRGYDGHYFWDTEIYVQPFLVATIPDRARALLAFRHAMLPAARRLAGTVNEVGALFPWRTINGEESSAYYLAGTAQYHINADVAFALRKYVQWTGDTAALRKFGAEILVETARLWASLGFQSPADGKFHIHGVTGPDEYTTVVDDNTYTNLLARENLAYASTVVDELRRADARAFAEFRRRLGLTDAELAAWERAASTMFIPFSEQLGIHPQDAHSLEKEVWDFAGTPHENYPLLLHYHPLVIYRFQVLKQADVVLAMLLLPARFTPDERSENFHYYERITTGDSSLSHSVQSVLAAEVGDEDLALQHFEHVLFMDLANWAGNAEDGVHIASAGGVWLSLVYGFAGLRDDQGNLSFDPRLPASWTELSFSLRVRGHTIAVRLQHDALYLHLREGEATSVIVRSEEIALRPREETRVPLAP